MTKIRSLVEQYNKLVTKIFIECFDDEDIYFEKLKESTNNFINDLKKIKIGNIITYNRLIEISLGLDKNNNNYKRVDENTKNARKILNALYNMNKDKFLLNFIEN
jgi:hypothetical protein